MNEPRIRHIVSFSWQKTKEILFPFEFKRWLKILLIVWLAGQGTGGNFNIPNRFRPPQEQTQTAAQNAQDNPALQSDQAVPGKKETGILPTLTSPEEEARRTMEQLGPWLFVLIPILLALSLFFMWLSARFHFIFLELVTLREMYIGEAFRKYKMQGNSLFLWSLGFMAVFLAGSLLCFLPALLFRSAAWLFFSVPLFLVFLMAVAVAGVLVFDFVTPMMYRDGIRTMEAFKKFLSLKPNIGSLFLYFLIKMGLGILGFLIALLVIFGAGLLVLLGALLLALIGAGLAAMVPFLKSFLLVLGAVFLVFSILALIVLFGLATLPIPIFFRVFSLGFLTRLIPEYNLLRIPLADSDQQA